MELKKLFGRLVAAHRKRRGLTQAELAEATGLSPDMIARVETGTTGASFGSIERLAEALSVDAAEFFTTELPKSAVNRRPLRQITARLASLSDEELAWVEGIVQAALSGRR